MLLTLQEFKEKLKQARGILRKLGAEGKEVFCNPGNGKTSFVCISGYEKAGALLVSIEVKFKKGEKEATVRLLEAILLSLESLK